MRLNFYLPILFILNFCTSLANARGPPKNVGLDFVPRTSNLINTHAYNMDWKEASLPICMILCLNSNRLTKTVQCNGVSWKSSGLGCTFLAIPPESYVKYDKTKPDKTIYVVEQYVNSISSYRLFGLGASTNLVFSNFFGPKSQLTTPFTNLWSFILPLKNLLSYLDHAGVNYNFDSRLFLACGGIQDNVTFSNISQNCWSFKTDPMDSAFSGPIQMAQPREYPSVVAVGAKTYIFGGNVANESMNDVEVFDPDTKKISTLAFGSLPVQFVGLISPCGITLNEDEAIVVTGGLINNVSQATTGLYYVKIGIWLGLSNLNSARFNHGCEKVLRKGRNFLIVYGGSQGTTSLSSIELFDLYNKTSPWIVSKSSLPFAMEYIIGHIATVFDDLACEMMIIDMVSKTMAICTGNYYWSTRSLTTKLPDGLTPLVAIDASLFIPYFV